MMVSGIIFVMVPPLVMYGVKTLVFLPRALLVDQVTGEVLDQVVEGNWSILSGQTRIRGLRFSVRRSAIEPAIWLAEDSRVGFRNANGQNVLIRWDSSVVNQEAIKRSITNPACPPVIGPEELLPYQAQDAQRVVRVLRITPATPIFRYYNQSGVQVATPLCSTGNGITTIRRVDVAFIVQTGSGIFDEGQAQEQVMTSVAIRVP